MDVQFTLRLPENLSSKIGKKAKALRLKRSDVVRLALFQFLEEPDSSASPYQSVKHLIGSLKTGVKDLGENHRAYILKKIKKEHARA